MAHLEEGGSTQPRHILSKVAADARVDLEEGRAPIGPHLVVGGRVRVVRVLDLIAALALVLTLTLTLT